MTETPETTPSPGECPRCSKSEIIDDTQKMVKRIYDAWVGDEKTTGFRAQIDADHDLVQALKKFAFGNGKKGAEERLTDLEVGQAAADQDTVTLGKTGLTFKGRHVLLGLCVISNFLTGFALALHLFPGLATILHIGG